MVFLELDLWRILTLLSVIFGLIILFIAINVITRCYGKLRKAFVYLTIALIILVVRSFFRLFDLIPSTYLESTGLIMNFLIILLIFFNLFSMKQMINGIDNHYRKR